MVKVMISMPKEMLKALDRLVKQGMYESRSEAIRDGIRILFQPIHEEEELPEFTMAGPPELADRGYS